MPRAPTVSQTPTYRMVMSGAFCDGRPAVVRHCRSCVDMQISGELSRRKHKTCSSYSCVAFRFRYRSMASLTLEATLRWIIPQVLIKPTKERAVYAPLEKPKT